MLDMITAIFVTINLEAERPVNDVPYDGFREAMRGVAGGGNASTSLSGAPRAATACYGFSSVREEAVCRHSRAGASGS